MIITGANVGLGFSSSKILASKGAHVILACRSKKKCSKAVTNIQASQPSAVVEPMTLDLSSFKSIQKFARTFQTKYPQGLDSLMLNAGIMMCPFSLTEDGIESQFGINHVGHHYLTSLMLPSLEKKAEEGGMTHVVSLSSSASFNAYSIGVRLTLEDINNKATYNRAKAYGQSKLSNILFAQELQERVLSKGIKNMIVTAVHPGAVGTNLGRHIIKEFPRFMQPHVEKLFHYFAKRHLVWEPDDAALSQIFAMTSPMLAKTPEHYRGKFIVPLARLGTTPVHATNMTLQRSLWKLTESIIEEKTKGVAVEIVGKSSEPTTTEATTGTATMGTATFGAGCFWSVELAFQRLPGVIATSVGYVGGTIVSPTYKGVASGTTGHAEAVQIEYDTSVLSYGDLLDVFFDIHDATQLNRQGGDVGTQYRSVIVAHTLEQMKISKRALVSADQQLATQILDSSKHQYWMGEGYHQQYLEKAGQSARKGDLAPIQCYGDRGPIKHLSKKEKLVKLFQQSGRKEQLEL